MSRDDFDRLTLMLGFALGGALRDSDRRQFYAWLAFVNELNATNPDFTPYEIPEEFRSAQQPEERP
jgi:hypothetical protein